MNNDNKLQETTELMIKENSWTAEDGEKVETYVYDNLYDSRKKNKYVPILGVIFLLLIISLVGYRTLFLVNKKIIIKNDVSTFFNLLDKSVDTFKENTFPVNFKEESVGFNGKVSFSSNYKDDDIDLTNLDKYNFEYNGAVDIKNNKLSLDAKLNKDNKALVSLNAFIKEKLALIKSNELSYDTFKYELTKEIKDLDFDNNFSTEDLDKLLTKTKTIVLDNVDNNKISKKILREKLSDLTESYILVSYTFDVKELITNIINSYKEDDEILDILSNIFGSSKDEVKKSLDNINLDSFDGYNLTINNYSTAILGRFKKAELVLSKNDKNLHFSVLREFRDYIFELYSKEESKIMGKYNIDSKELSVNYNVNDTSFNANLKKENNIYVSKISYIDSKESVNININFESNCLNDKKEDKLTIDFDIKNESNNNISFKVNSEFTMFKNASVNEFNDYFAKNINSLSETDLYLIQIKAGAIVQSIKNDFIKPDIIYDLDSYDNDDILDYNL